MRTLGKDRTGVANWDRASRIVIERHIGWNSKRLVRGREIPGIAGVECRSPERLVGKIDARAELILVDIGDHLIEPSTVIHRELIGQLPLILKIAAEKPTELVASIVDGERRIDGVAGGIKRLHRPPSLDLR